VAKLGTDQDRGYAKPFAVSGGNVVEMIGEFQNTDTLFQFEESEYKFEIQILLGSKDKWKTLREYAIYVCKNNLPRLNQSLITHDNQ